MPCSIRNDTHDKVPYIDLLEYRLFLLFYAYARLIRLLFPTTPLVKTQTIPPRLLILHGLEIIRREAEGFEDAVAQLYTTRNPQRSEHIFYEAPFHTRTNRVWRNWEKRERRRMGLGKEKEKEKEYGRVAYVF